MTEFIMTDTPVRVEHGPFDGKQHWLRIEVPCNRQLTPAELDEMRQLLEGAVENLMRLVIE